MRRTRLIIEPMDRRIFNPGNSFDEMLFQLTHLLHFFIQILVNCLRCKRQSCNTRNIFRTGADILLLFSSKQNWFDLHFAVNIQHSRSFRSMNLMTADGAEIYTQFLRMDPVFAKSLYCIYMKQNIFIICFHNTCRFCDRLYRTNFIIYIHHRHQYRFITECLLQCL